MRGCTGGGSLGFSVVVLVCGLLSACASGPPADVIFLGGKVHTVDPHRPRATAVAARDGFIVYVGSDRGANAYRGPDTEVIELAGSTVVPGLNDAHMHLDGVGLRELNLRLEGAASLGDLLRRVEERVEAEGQGRWIVGRGWIETFWEPARFPTRHDLDTIAPRNPVWLVRVDGHGGVANTAALELAGIDPSTPDPPGGQILRDDDGRPTGMLLGNAHELVTAHIPPTTDAELDRALEIGARVSAERGWTGIQVAGNSWETARRIRALVESGKIRIRVHDAILGPGAEADRLLEEGPTIGGRGGRFTLRTIKVSYDGALGSGGAALLRPYLDRPGTGFLEHEDAALRPLLERALRRGIQVQVHAVGDRANRKILDLFEQALRRVPETERAVADPRWRVEHAQILDPVDLPRFVELGVVPSMQPSHAITDLHFATARLGAERLVGAYAWRALIDSGAFIPGGSDAPAERGDPIIEFYAAVARRDLKGYQGPDWHDEQRVTRQEALEMFTIWAARAVFEEDWRGSIVVGKACDLTVLSADIMTIPEAEIPRARVEMTVVAGEVIHRAVDR